jgi:dolichyldiphosphatase
MFADTLRARHVPRAAPGGAGGFDGDAAPGARERLVAVSADSTSAQPDGPPTVTQTSRLVKCLSYINESTKFLVSGAALATLVTKPEVAVVWCLIGSVVNSACGKVLKKLLNEKRPEGAAKADPGMPSSHALSLSYLSVYAAAALASRGGVDGGAIGTSALQPWPVSATFVIPGCVSLIALGVFFTWLRVKLGYHTKPQVVVGYVLGAATAMVWLAIGEQVVVPAATNDKNVVFVLYGVCAVTSALFAKVAVKWVDEVKLLRGGGKAKSG